MNFWEKYSKNRKCNIETFRDTNSNNIFTTWNPYSNGLPYYNLYIYKFIIENKIEFIKYKNKTNNFNYGNPPHIFFNNKYKICFDECIAFEEVSFLKKFISKSKDQKILEIGAGYGRLVEGIIKNFSIKDYTIIDYKNILTFAKKYLSKTLSKKEYKKLKFIEFEKFNFHNSFFDEKVFDLTINVDSFPEMEPKIIKKYLKFIKKNSKSFYSKNTVDKYYPKDMVNHLGNKNVPNFIKKLGLNRKTINVFNQEELNKSKIRYLNNYNPYMKKLSKNNYQFSNLISYYLHAYFKKD